MLAGSIGYGAVRGGHIPTVAAQVRDARDVLANAAGLRIGELSVAGTRQLTKTDILAGADMRGMPDVNIPDEGLNFTSVVSQLERELILRCLQKTGGNKRQAARLLQLSRTTFIDKMQRLNVAPGAA